MRKIQNLGNNDYIYCKNKKESKKIFKICMLPPLNIYPCWVGKNTTGFFWTTTEISSGNEYPASDFLPKKSKKASKKWVRKEIENALMNKDNEIKATDAENVAGELEVGKWHTDNEEQLIFITAIYADDLSAYGFSYMGWNEEIRWYGNNMEGARRKLKPATLEQVKSALIEEAEKRGYKEGIIIHSPNAKKGYNFTLKELLSYTYEDGELYYSMGEGYRISVMKDGKWAEIVEQPKEIDWNVPGLFISQNSCIVQSNGAHSGDSFSGMCVTTGDESTLFDIREDWWKPSFKPYTGEPIILKP